MKSILSKNTLWGLLFFLPVGLYFYFLSEYALNIPKWDDHALKAFIVEFQNANGLISKLQTFFKQHNEHRIAFDRFFTLVVFWTHGSIDYRWLMWIGNFTLLGILFIFFKIFQKQKISIAYFIPIPFILFQLQLWENTFWGMAALQNFGVVFFILTLIYLISSEKRSHFYTALFVAFLATYTSGNGITIFPVCIVLLVLQRRFKDVFIFSSVSIILVFLYFYQYKFPENNPSMDGIGIKKIALGFFMFIGSVFDLIPNTLQNQKITIGLGFILFVTGSIIAIYLIFNSKLFKKQRNLNHTELFILGTIMFLIGTAIVVTYTRISYGEASLLTSRYKIYSILVLITIYLAVISKLNLANDKWIAFAVIFMAIFFNLIANFTHFKDVVNFRNLLISFAMNWKLQPGNQINKSNIILYVIPKLDLDKNEDEIKKNVKSFPINFKKYTKLENNNTVLIQSRFNPKWTPMLNSQKDYFIIVQSTKRTYLTPSQLANYPIKSFIRNLRYWENGLNCILDKSEFENDKYYLGLLTKYKDNTEFYYLNDSLIVNNTKPKSIKTNW